MKYKLLQSESPERLSDDVSSYLADGWVLYDAPIVSKSASDRHGFSTTFAQAVIYRWQSSKGQFMTEERDAMRELCIRQGYVPSTCTLPGPIVLAATETDGDACKGCNENRAVCKGRPKG